MVFVRSFGNLLHKLLKYLLLNLIIF